MKSKMTFYFVSQHDENKKMSAFVFQSIGNFLSAQTACPIDQIY